MNVYHSSPVVVEHPDTQHSFAGDISKEECLSRLIFEQPNNQICIRTQAVLDQSLEFINSQRL